MSNYLYDVWDPEDVYTTHGGDPDPRSLNLAYSLSRGAFLSLDFFDVPAEMFWTPWPIEPQFSDEELVALPVDHRSDHPQLFDG